ncbi:MAG: hypothetical protein ACI906_002269 [Candidatus Latescibacterota bacterium]|jgi:hypothetical protein
MVNADGGILQIDICHKVIRYCTGVILGAFVLMIVITTISSDPWVLSFGKALYWLIVGAAFFSLAVWLWRKNLEKDAEVAPDQGS